LLQPSQKYPVRLWIDDDVAVLFLLLWLLFTSLGHPFPAEPAVNSYYHQDEDAGKSQTKAKKPDHQDN
jgi:hypothetical protein